MQEETISSGKVKAFVAYLTLLGTIIAIFMNLDEKNPYSRFHIRQAFGIFVLFYLLAAVVTMFDSILISGGFYVFFFVLWGYGIINALQGITKPIPLVGEYFQKWFTFIS